MTDSISHSYPTLVANPHLLSLLLQATDSSQSKSMPVKQKQYVDSLVDITVQAIHTIWPQPIVSHKPVASLTTFLRHILKHSRTTHSTLQLAIFYLFRARTRIQKNKQDGVASCGRRMFLAALICAHKYLQDKTYKNVAWSKVSGLKVAHVNVAEKTMLQLLDWQLHVKKETYDQWLSMLQTHLM